MNNNDITEYLSDTQKLAILLLSSNLFEPVRGKTWYQKELFLIVENIPQLKEETDFEEDYLGPYSEFADNEFDQLKIEGIVEKRKPRLTQYGRSLAKSLEAKASKKLLHLISDIKSLLNNLDEDELLGFIYFSYPEFTIESIEFERIKKNRLPIAISLFRKRKISLGKASKIAGISQEELVKIFGEKGISVFSK